tara:strand:+ start:807 stop:956 length:150 start_codon:yes stop_codon:yes gene_type:complete
MRLTPFIVIILLYYTVFVAIVQTTNRFGESFVATTCGVQNLAPLHQEIL